MATALFLPVSLKQAESVRSFLSTLADSHESALHVALLPSSSHRLPERKQRTEKARVEHIGKNTERNCVTRRFKLEGGGGEVDVEDVQKGKKSKKKRKRVAHKELTMFYFFRSMSYKTNDACAEFVVVFAGIVISFHVLFTVFVPAVLLTAK